MEREEGRNLSPEAQQERRKQLIKVHQKGNTYKKTSARPSKKAQVYVSF